MSELIESIDKSAEFEAFIRQTYSSIMKSLSYSTEQFDIMSFGQVFRLYAGQALEYYVGGISQYPAEIREISVKMVVWNFLNVNTKFDKLPEAGLYGLSKDIASRFTTNSNIDVGENTTKLDSLRLKIIKQSRSS